MTHSAPTPFLYRPFSSEAYRITAYFDHKCPDYNRNGTDNALTIFSGHTLGSNCWSFDWDGSEAPECTGPVKGYNDLLWELPYLFYGGHDGYDFAVTGQALAAARGIVSYVGNKGGCGWTVEMAHDLDGGGYVTRYCHLENRGNERFGVYAGTLIRNAGQPIGVVGSTGSASSGTHLHFSVLRYDHITGDHEPVDPYGWDVSVSPEDPLVACNGQQSYNLWVDGWPSLPGQPPASPSPPVEGEYRGGWLGALDPHPSTDHATFVSHVTIPDDTIVSPGQSLNKVWRVRNSGTSTWGSGYQLAFVGGEQMGGPSATSVPNTMPGQETNLSISLTAPLGGGSHVGYWQLRNPQGTYFGPRLWVQVNVQSPSSYGITLSADPPSPSNADSVRIHARVDNFPNFRAMRLQIDGSIVYELGAPEFTYDWITSGYAAGDHSIVVEVADQTDTSWSRPERRGISYSFEGSPAPANHAPNRPTPSSPYDWYVYYSGNTAQLCGQANGDPDGDAITGYYFQIYDSAQLWNSGWVGSNCATTSALGPYNYQWRLKVRDGGGAESEWSDPWHFTIVNPSLSISELYFEPQDANSEQVKIRACTTGQGGVGITMRVSVNDASDGSGSGTWHIIKELGVPCFNDIDAPVWHTLQYGDGPHRVRAEAHGADASWDGAAVREEVYTLPHRRPPSTRLLAPVPLSGNIREALYLNSRTVSFLWEPTIRASSYTLHVSTSPSPKDDASPVFRQTFGAGAKEHEVTFSQDYGTLYWQVSTANDAGSNASGDQFFGIDRLPPTCTVQPLPTSTPESVFQVSWGGSDNLSGVRSFDVQYLDSERGEWSDWLTDVPETKTYALYTGQPGHSYGFRCRATDNANNRGDNPTGAQSSTMVDPTARPPTPWWDEDYSGKRNITILNNMAGSTLPAGYPVHLHFDGSTTPTAAELYGDSQSSPKCNDLRIVHSDVTQLDRVVDNCSTTAVDIWFRTQVSTPGGSSNSTDHQLYYGNPAAGTPPGSMNTVFYPIDDANTVGLWYTYEGSGSTLHDTSGNGHNCTIDGTTTWIATQKFSGALHFLGGTDGPTVNCGTSSTFNLQTFSFETYVKRTGTAWGRLAGHLGNSQARWLMAFNGDGRIRVEIWPCSTCGSEVFISNRALSDTSHWHHIAFTLQNRTLKIYVDGQLDSTGQVVWGNIRSGTPPLTFGSAESIQRAFAEVSHVRLSNIARTSFPHGAFAAVTNEPSVAVGNPVTPPVTVFPDLAVLDLSTYPYAGGGVLVEVVVENQGPVETENGFYTDLYVDHVPSGPGDYASSIRFWVNDPIPAGATVTLSTVVTELSGPARLSGQSVGEVSEQSGVLYSQVDSTGAVGEPDEVNNIYSSGAEMCVASPDAHESDDSSAKAGTVPVGQVQTHNISGPDDADWIQFDAHEGVAYSIETSNLGIAADTYLYLYDTDATILLAANDDFGGALASHIAWQAPADGTYYVMARHWNPSVSGCGTAYDLSVALHGDFDLDCELTVADIMAVASRWGCACGDACYDPAYDLDSDCGIDIVDVMLVASKWGCQCGDGCYLGTTLSAVPGAAIALAEPATVRVVPGRPAVAPGEMFSVAVVMDGAAELGAFQCELGLDPAVVRVDDVTLGGLLGSTGRSVVPLGPEIDNDAGTVAFGGFSFGDQPGPGGDGVLATIILMAQGTGSSQLTLENVQVADRRGQPLRITVEHGRVIVGVPRRIHLPLIVGQ